MVHWKNGVKKSVVPSMILGTALLLNACGGGGSGSSGGGSVGSGGGTTATYLAYIVKGGGLYLVDPANPTQPIKITDKAVNILLNKEKEYAVSSLDPNTMQYKDLHVRAIYYVEGDKGPLMKLSLVKGSSTPQPVQVSNLNDVCNAQESEALVGPQVMIVETAGKDGKCNTPDDSQYIVTSDMTSNSKPIDLNGKDVVTFVVGNDLKVKGTIITESNTLKFCNVDLSNCSQLAQGVTVVYDIASNTQNEYLCVDGKIQIFDKSKNTLSQTSTVCKNGVSDDKYIYYVNNGNIEILDMNKVVDGWKTIYNSGDINNIVGITQNYLIAYATGEMKLVAIKKDGSSKTVISDGNATNPITTPNRLYFTKYTIDANGKDIDNACYWDEVSVNPVCDPGTAWVGLSYAVNGTLNYSSYFTVYKLLKVEGSNGGKGGTLYAVDSSNLTKIKLGDIPPNFSVGGSGIGDNILLLGYEDISTDKFQSDVFFANLSTPNSLQNITKTPDKNEYPR